MRESLKASLGPIEFSDLRAHLARAAVIVVDASLDLLDVAEAVARDDKSRVAAWVEAGHLQKPSLETIERWSKMTDAAWTAVVVQPFGLYLLDVRRCRREGDDLLRVPLRRRRGDRPRALGAG